MWKAEETRMSNVRLGVREVGFEMWNFLQLAQVRILCCDYVDMVIRTRIILK
jgi:hypothetical protein